jgi:hypothetical protein
MTPEEYRRLYQQQQMRAVRNHAPNPQMSQPLMPRPPQYPSNNSARYVNPIPNTRTTGGCCGRRRSQG